MLNIVNFENAISNEEVPRSQLFYNLLRSSIGFASFDVWFKNFDLKEISNTEVQLGFPSIFIRDWVSTYYYDLVQEACLRIYKRRAVFLGEIKASPICKDSTLSTPLNENFTFDSFCVDPSNELAYHAVQESGQSSKMTLIYGDSGNGKTHLAQSFVKRLANNGSKVLYMRSQDYIFHYISAIKNKVLLEFKEELFNHDVYVLENIDYLKDKTSTQISFLELIEHALSHGKYMLLTSQNQFLYEINSQIKQHVYANSIICLNRPSDALRIRVAQRESDIEDSLLGQIVAKTSGSMREILGIIARLKAHTDFYKISLTSHNIDKILSQLNINSKKVITEEFLIATVANFYQVEINNLLSSGRTKVLIRARRALMYLLRDVLKKSLREIGKLFGNTGHTNALQNLKRLALDLSQNVEIQNELQEIKDLLNA